MSRTWTKTVWGRRDAAIAIMVGTLAGCATTAVAGQAGTGQATQPATTAATTTMAKPQPTLGRVWGPGGQEGYGKVRPSTVFNGGDPTGLVEHITWSSWGSAKAIGTGESYYVPPNGFTAEAKLQGATIVAFDLGECGGHPAYLAVEWYFPEHGGKFNSKVYINDCTGKYVGNWA
jgi:hypothetical protein